MRSVWPLGFGAVLTATLLWAQQPQLNPSPQKSTTTEAQAARACTVVLDDIGNVGMRISDAELVAKLVMTELIRRVGRDRVSYGGMAKTARQMKKMLAGSATDTSVQDKQIARWEACEKSASWHVNARFGIKQRRHWIELSCKHSNQRKVIDSKRVTGANYKEALDALSASITAFCPGIKSEP